jgi:hypothetical protein
MIGRELADLVVDGCLTKAPSGGEVAGRSAVARGTQGLQRSVVTAGSGSPLHLVSAGANCRPEGSKDAPLRGPPLAGLDQLDRGPETATVHLDRGSDGRPTRVLLDPLGCAGASARKGVPALIQAGSRWGVERSFAWKSRLRRLVRDYERRLAVLAGLHLVAFDCLELAQVAPLLRLA